MAIPCTSAFRLDVRQLPETSTSQHIYGVAQGFRLPWGGHFSSEAAAWHQLSRQKREWLELLPSWAPMGRPQSVLANLAEARLDDCYGLASAGPSSCPFEEFDMAHSQVDLQSFMRLLKTPISFAEGKHVHAHIIETGLEHENSLANLLITMYGKCKAVDRARLVFDKIHRRDVVCWTVMIAVYTHHKLGIEALQLFGQMQQEGVKPDKVTYITILSACVTREHGVLIHSSIVQCAFQSDMVVGTALVNMYGRFGSVKDARSVFDQMAVRNVISWNSMIAAYAQQDQAKEAIQLFINMQSEGIKANRVTCLNLIGVFGRAMDKVEGMLLHSCIIYSRFDADVVIQNALINMYGKFGAIEDACAVFTNMQLTDRISWNTMIAVYEQQGHSKECLELFNEMCQRDVEPDQITLVSVLTACASLDALVEGKEVHASIVRNEGIITDGFQSNVLGTALVNMYGKCGALEDARKVFKGMSEHDVVSWTAMISAYAVHGKGNEALELFQNMQKQGLKPNSATFVSILTACTCLGTSFDGSTALTQGKWVHGCICYNGFETNVIVGNALINMYGKCRATVDARCVFDKLHYRNVVSWTSMIAAYVEQGLNKAALQLFRDMQLEGVKPDKVTFLSILSACASLEDVVEGKVVHTCIVDDGLESDIAIGNALVCMYGKCGALREARSMFEKLLARDVISWNAMITYYVQQGHDKEAFQLYQHMQYEGVKPNAVTFVGLLGACANKAAIMKGELIHSCISDTGLEVDIVMGNALVNMYGKCGAVELASSMFAKMQERDAHSWTALIAAHAQQGQGRAALELFQQMLVEGVKPDKVTFVSVLCGCSHAGLLEEGLFYFVSMSEDHGITPSVEHYLCMIDLLGRAGWLDEAEDFIYEMGIQPDVRLWAALLGACRMHGDTDRGKRVAEHMFGLDPYNAATYVLLSNLYAEEGGMIPMI